MITADRSDIRRGDWVDRWLPASARPYARLMRLDRPIGWWLLLLPGWMAIALPMRPLGLADLWAGILFLAGAVVMRGAGCTVNDITDRDFDAQVARTRTRPLPAGDITLAQALVFLAALLLIGLVILLQFNRLTILCGAASLVLIVVYPQMKRITWWPQAFLGITFSWGALVGWTAVTGVMTLPSLLLYAGCIAWTIGYDTF